MRKITSGLYVLLSLVLIAGTLAGCGPKPAPVTQDPPPPPRPVLSFTIDTEGATKDVAEAIAQQLTAIGIDVQVRVWPDWPVLRAALVNKERHAYLGSWGNSTLDPYDLLNPKFQTGGRGNYSHYSNAELDKLLTDAATGTDPAARAAMYKRAQEIIYNDAPWVFAYTLQEIEACSTLIGNWVPATDSRINLHDVTIAQGDTIVVGLRASIEGLDPAAYRGRIGETVVRNMFDGLVTRTPDGRVVPEVAESWQALSPVLWEFKIRQGITFHNGDPLTADDVVFTFERIINEGGLGDGKSSPRRAGLLEPVTRVEKIDDYTVRFHLSDPWPIILQMLVHQQIVPKNYVQRVGSAQFALSPIGCGPFKFVEGTLDDRIVMERYEGYYGGSPDQPPVGIAPAKRAIFRVMPDNAVRVAALKAGEVHIIQSVLPAMVPELRASPNVEVKTALGTRVFFLELNVTKAPFDDVRVRQALNYAINWNLIIDKVLGGYATRLAGPLLPHGFGLDQDRKPYPYDPEKAKQLLQAAGFQTK
ncbi:MAG: ABC transporter substrate-binding protein [Bacillota bacterium]